MTKRRSPDISPRKQPKQERSTELVAIVLKAAVQVLEKEGARHFTMARVAEKAGVSVGSLYQYFPNKAAILFRLQADEWRETSELLRVLLEDHRKPPFERLRALVHAFLRSECAEAAVRIALDDAAPLYRDAPEAKKARASGDGSIRAFMQEVLPRAPETTRALAGSLIATTLGTVGQHFSARPRTDAEIDVYADAMADMFCAYLGRLRSEPGRGTPTSLVGNVSARGRTRR